jgi:glycosyltransferase involved in cell wall biosynthesis
MSADIAVIIAAKNEAATVGDVVRCALRFADQVIVVDGHSRDGTRELSRDAGAEVLLDRGLGKGDALRLAIDHIERPITVFVDADGSHVISDIPHLVEPIRRGDAEHVTASRLLGGSSELHGGFDEFFRLAGSSFITACINRRFGVRLSDTQNGFRAVRTDVLRALGLRENHTTIEQEMVMRTLRLGYRIIEYPSHERARMHGQSHVSVYRHSPAYLWCLARNLLR